MIDLRASQKINQPVPVFGLGESALTECIVCGEEPCIVAVSDPEHHDGEEVFYAVALKCPICGLYIDKNHEQLARFHYGPITEKRIGSKAWAKDVPR